MIRTDEDALICDLAETYHIFDYRQLPASLVAVFSVGLRPGSRIYMAMNDEKMTVEQTILAGVLDRLSILLWSKTKDGQDGINKPTLILDSIFGIEKEKEEIASFESGEEFMRAREELLKKGGN